VRRGHAIHAAGDLLAEVEQLENERVKRSALRDGRVNEVMEPRRRSSRTSCRSSPSWSRHAPLEGETNLFRIEEGLGETCVGEDGGSPLAQLMRSNSELSSELL